MNKEEPFRDQAERLKRRIEKINEQTVENDLLPPREQVHRQKKKKTKIKIKYPVIRLLVFFFILLPIIYFSVISYLDGKQLNRSVKTSGDTAGYEPINIVNHKSGTDKNAEKKDNIEGSTDTNQPSNKTEAESSIDSTDVTKTTNSNESTSVRSNSDKIQQPVQTESNQQDTNTKSSSGTQSTDSGTSVQPNSTPKPAVSTTKMIYHTVKAHETLYRIAVTYYHSGDGVNIIKEANHLSNEQIKEGQVLKIPIKN